MKLRRLVLICGLTVLTVVAWRRLGPGQRAYLTSIVRQVPDMPGRYAV